MELLTLVAGTSYRGDFEERLRDVVEEVTDPESPPTVLFVDKIHSIVGAANAEGGIDAANVLKPALARGKLRVVGATTSLSEYHRYVEEDAALERRLQPVLVVEPTSEACEAMLRESVAPKYGSHHTCLVSSHDGSFYLSSPPPFSLCRTLSFFFVRCLYTNTPECVTTIKMRVWKSLLSCRADTRSRM